MKEMTVSELREALRKATTRADGKRTMSDAQIDVKVEKIVQMRERMKPVCDEHGVPLAPEEQIKCKPALAFDTPEPGMSDEEKVTELLRWFHRPADALGRTVYVPEDHPSGLGGCRFYIPKDSFVSQHQQKVGTDPVRADQRSNVTLDDIEANIHC